VRTTATTTVSIGRAASAPGGSTAQQADREPIEDLVRVFLGFEVIRESQRRNALPEDETVAEATRAVHHARRSVKQ
jgi:hypothetical protein